MTTLLRPSVCALVVALLLGTPAVGLATASEDPAFCYSDEARSSATAGVGVNTVEDASATGAPHSHLYGYDGAATSGAATTASGVGMEVLPRTGDSGYVYDSPLNLVATNAIDDILSKPVVSNPKLQNIVDDLYKGTTNPNRVGTGTTADAVRNELVTGLPTGGTFHSEKAQIYINGLNNVLKTDLSASDRLVAQSLLDDLVGALGGAP